MPKASIARRNSAKSNRARPNPMPNIGLINGEISIAPITTAGEESSNPRMAMPADIVVMKAKRAVKPLSSTMRATTCSWSTEPTTSRRHQRYSGTASHLLLVNGRSTTDSDWMFKGGIHGSWLQSHSPAWDGRPMRALSHLHEAHRMPHPRRGGPITRPTSSRAAEGPAIAAK